MQSTAEHAEIGGFRPLVVGNIVSLLCVGVLAIYLWSESAEGEKVLTLLLFGPLSTFHAIPLLLLLLRPGATAVTACLVISALGSLLSVWFMPIAVLDWAMANNPLASVLNLTYLCSQVWILYQGIIWKKVERGSHRHFEGRDR